MSCISLSRCSRKTLFFVCSSAGLLVTAVFSAAPCVQSWQMCSGTDVTRPNLEPWSETFLKVPERSHCPPLLPLHRLSLLSIDNQQPHPPGPRHNFALTRLPGWIWASPVPKSCTPSHQLLITPLYHSSAQQGRTRWAPVRQTERCCLGCWTVSATEPVLHSPSAHKQQSDGERERER